MKHKITTNEDGSVTLTLGTHKEVTFENDATMPDVCDGVEALIADVTGISLFKLGEEVVDAFVADERRRAAEAVETEDGIRD